jgi:L-gulonate 5-dehydrogenase
LGRRSSDIRKVLRRALYRLRTVIEWLQKGLIDPDKLITHAFDYQHVIDAIEVFEKDQRKCCKVLLTFSDEQ